MITLLLVVLLVVLACKAVSVWHDRRSLEQWAFLLAIAGVALTLLLEIPRAYPESVPDLDVRLARLAQNLIVVAAFGVLQLFYLRYVSRFLRRPRLVAELIVIGAVATVLVVCTSQVVAMGAGLDAEPSNLRLPAVVTFYLVGGGYVMYAVGTQLWWTARFARRPDVVDPVVRRAASGAAVGSLLIFVGEALRTVGTLVHYSTGNDLGGLEQPSIGLILLGTPVLVVSLGLPVLLAQFVRGRRWLQQCRAYLGLGPLWRVVAHTYPEVIRPPRPVGTPVPASWLGWRRRPLSMAFHHRLGQCREGYLRANGLGPDDHPQDPVDTRAAALAAHLRACPKVELNTAPSASTADIERGLPSDTDDFLAVSRALRRRGLH